MKGPDFLKEHSGRIKTRMGAFIPGQRAIFRGNDLHADLGNIDWMELYLLGITGRRFTEQQTRLLHGIWVCTSYPDPRIWNNRVASLAGSARSTGALGVAASLAVSEAAIYGGGIYIPSIEFLQRTRKAMEKGADMGECVLAELKTRRSIAGYGRPLISGDERIKPIIGLATSVGLDQGPHVRLAFAVDEFLKAGRWRLSMNYGAIAAALCADVGLSPQEYYFFMFPTFMAGMPPCYIESAERAEGTLFPLSCSDIRYEGPGKRCWGSRDQ